MIWLKNLENIATKRISGKCPCCGCNDTDYTLIGKVGSMGYGEIWCNECKRAYHISRIQVLDGFNLNKEVPKDIVH